MCDGHDTMIYLIVMTILSILVTVGANDVFQNIATQVELSQLEYENL